jgi:hypothetical protein
MSTQALPSPHFRSRRSLTARHHSAHTTTPRLKINFRCTHFWTVCGGGDGSIMIFKSTGRRLLGNKSHYDVGGSVGRSNSRAAKGWAPIAPINLSLKWSLLLRTYFGRTRANEMVAENSLRQQFGPKRVFFFSHGHRALHTTEIWILIRQVHNDVSLCGAESITSLAFCRQGHVRHLLCSAGPLLLLKAANFNETLFTAVAFWYIFGIHTGTASSAAWIYISMM